MPSLKYEYRSFRLLRIDVDEANKEIYSKEEEGFNQLKEKLRHWKKEGVSNCSIKSFTQAYINFVADKYKKELQKYGKETAKAKT